MLENTGPDPEAYGFCTDPVQAFAYRMGLCYRRACRWCGCEMTPRITVIRCNCCDT